MKHREFDNHRSSNFLIINQFKYAINGFLVKQADNLSTEEILLPELFVCDLDQC